MTSCIQYKCCFSPVLDLSSHLGFDNSVINDCYMLKAHLFNSHKCQCLKQCSLWLNETLQSLSKKQKLSHLSESQSSAAFWDNLSKIWLIKHTLKELNWRNTQSSSNSPHSLYWWWPHQSVTQHTLAELKKNCQPTQSVTDFLCHCALRCLKNIKLFVRHSDSDLLNLKDVCNCQISADVWADHFLFSTWNLSILLITQWAQASSVLEVESEIWHLLYISNSSQRPQLLRALSFMTVSFNKTSLMMTSTLMNISILIVESHHS